MLCCAVIFAHCSGVWAKRTGPRGLNQGQGFGLIRIHCYFSGILIEFPMIIISAAIKKWFIGKLLWKVQWYHDERFEIELWTKRIINKIGPTKETDRIDRHCSGYWLVGSIQTIYHPSSIDLMFKKEHTKKNLIYIGKFIQEEMFLSIQSNREHRRTLINETIIIIIIIYLKIMKRWISPWKTAQPKGTVIIK